MICHSDPLPWEVDPQGDLLIIPLHIKYGVKRKRRRTKGGGIEKPSPKEIKAWLDFMNSEPLGASSQTESEQIPKTVQLDLFKNKTA